MKRTFRTKQANSAPAVPEGTDATTAINRRNFLAGVAGTAVLSAVSRRTVWAETPEVTVNLAKVATPSSLFISGDAKLGALNDGNTPRSSRDGHQGVFGTWPHTETQWVQYEWSKPVTTDKVDVYWWADGGGVSTPSSYRVLYWDGSDFVPVSDPHGLGVATDRFNTTSFDQVKTTKLRLEIVSDGTHSPGILEWKVFSSGPVPLFPPTVNAGVVSLTRPAPRQP